MPSSSALPEILKSITAAKVSKLVRHQKTCEEKKWKTFESAKVDTKSLAKVGRVLKGTIN